VYEVNFKCTVLSFRGPWANIVKLDMTAVMSGHEHQNCQASSIKSTLLVVKKVKIGMLEMNSGNEHNNWE
jgi:hypothetical protein